MNQYHDLLRGILKNGEDRSDRTGTGTTSVFGRQIRFNLEEGFPAVTTKKLAWKSVVSELLWFLSGDTSERKLREFLHGDKNSEKTTIWTANAEASYWKNKAKFPGDLGRIYQAQWRDWKSVKVVNEEYQLTKVDQIDQLIDGIKNDPYSRRHILSAWNPGEIDEMALPPCHVLSQYYVSNDSKLSCHMFQRSQDVFLGGPFNYASYALLTHMIAHVCGLGVKELIISIGDAHIYNDHIDQVHEQLSRDPLPLPNLKLNSSIKDINMFTMSDIELLDYKCHSPIKAAMAV